MALPSTDRVPVLPETPLFLLTVDTEEEWDWRGAFPVPPCATRNTREIPAFQERCNELAVRPTYFVDQAVADDPDAVDALRRYLRAGQCDIGAHLHPWCTPPLEEARNEHHSHAVNLPDDLFERKLDHLTAHLTDRFGLHPHSYRAGRWGVNGRHLNILAAAGYRVDSSVRPFYVERSFSYVGAPTRPYWPDFDELLEPGEQRRLLEVPTTSGYDRAPFELLDAVHGLLTRAPLARLRLVGLLWRLRLMRKITVTPEGHDARDICRCIDASIRRGDRVVVMFFHSSDLLPGSTPYVRTAADKVRFMDRLARCVDHVRDRHGARAVTMRELPALLLPTA